MMGGQEARVPSRCGARLVLSGRKRQELESVRARCLEAGRYRDLQVLPTVHGVELFTASYLQPDQVMVLPLDLAKLESHTAAVRTVLGKMTKVTASWPGAASGNSGRCPASSTVRPGGLWVPGRRPPWQRTARCSR